MEYWLTNLKCYSDQHLGAIQIDLTPLTLRISEDSAKQLMIKQLFGGISMIRLLGQGNVSYVSPAHSEMGILTQGILTWEKVTLIKKIGRDV